MKKELDEEGVAGVAGVQEVQNERRRADWA
jgi:hypothetical protein